MAAAKEPWRQTVDHVRAIERAEQQEKRLENVLTADSANRAQRIVRDSR